MSPAFNHFFRLFRNQKTLPNLSFPSPAVNPSTPVTNTPPAPGSPGTTVTNTPPTPGSPPDSIPIVTVGGATAPTSPTNPTPPSTTARPPSANPSPPLATPSPPAKTTAPAPASSGTFGTLSADGQALVTAINQVRQKNGVAALTVRGGFRVSGFRGHVLSSCCRCLVIVKTWSLT